VPLGIGTMGNGAIGAQDLVNVTPFAEGYPGTTRQHGALTLKAVALSRGEGHEVVLVRSDTVGVFQHLREAVLNELELRLGRRLDHGLILAGNHTHSGPGRLLDATGVFELLADTFFPEFYDNMVDAFADVVEQAIADQKPAEIGHAVAESHEGHNDRRCENDALDQVQEDPSLPLVAIRRDGKVDAIVASYAYHGTIFGLEDLTLSGDMGGAVEERIEERFDRPVMVMLFNSWGADMAPGSGTVDANAAGADQPDGYDRMDALGELLADAVVPAVEAIVFEGDPTVRARTFRPRLDREVIGYDEETFFYPNGGVYCGLGGEGNCTDATPKPAIDRACLAFPADWPPPKQTMASAGQIGELYFVTGAGEWGTHLVGGMLDKIREHTGGGDVMFIGYANDYTGYSLTEEDWWQGGYEASGAMWGPRQGDYLVARSYEVFETYFDQYLTPPFEQPEPVEPFSGYSYDAYVPETAVNAGTIAEDVAATAGPSDVVKLTVLGSDPWLGVPIATLEKDNGGSFEPVLKTNGTVVQSDAYEFWVDLAVDPPYDQDASERSFSWAIHFPVARRAGSNVPTLSGNYRLSVRVPLADGSESVVESGVFSVQ
jgi:hypothetical protein